MGLDAILLITGWDGCYNLGSKRLVEWLCESPGTQPADIEDALEEGLFVVTPDDVEWFIAHETDVPVQVSIAEAPVAAVPNYNSQTFLASQHSSQQRAADATGLPDPVSTIVEVDIPSLA